MVFPENLPPSKPQAAPENSLLLNDADRTAHGLAAPIYWNSFSDLVREPVIAGMNNRANVEAQCIVRGDDLVAIHGEAAAGFQQYRLILDWVDLFLRRNGRQIAGEVADLGSGIGTGATVVSGFPAVRKVYAVEYSSSSVEKIMPLTFAHFQANVGKIQRIIGDFNRLQWPDESLDWIVELSAYHHSEDLRRTLSEAFRVLRPGGGIVAVERVHHDSRRREELEALLDQPFKADVKRRYGIPVEQPFTRRDWGEHEWREGEWLAAYHAAGFNHVIVFPWWIRGLRFLKPKRVWTRLFPLIASAGFALAGSVYRQGTKRFAIPYPESFVLTPIVAMK